MIGTQIIPRSTVGIPKIALPPTVVLALSSKERKLFFDSVPDRLAGSPLIWRETASGNLRWPDLLKELRPAVLVTGWSTPRIPKEWALSPDSPLRYICHVAGSLRNVASREFFEAGIVMSNWGAKVAYTVAEHAMLLVLGALRNLRTWEACHRQQDVIFAAITRLRSKTLRGKRVGLHGFGAIARELVALLRPYKVSISAYSRNVPHHLYHDLGVHPATSLTELFSQSDVLIECEALTPETTGTVTREILAVLPYDAVFVNVGRAGLVDQSALVEFAAAGRIRLGLDVFEKEPLPPDSPYLQIGTALLSPHVAGPTWDTYQHLGRHALENIERFLSGEPLDGEVTQELFDRST